MGKGTDKNNDNRIDIFKGISKAKLKKISLMVGIIASICGIAGVTIDSQASDGPTLIGSKVSVEESVDETSTNNTSSNSAQSVEGDIEQDTTIQSQQGDSNIMESNEKSNVVDDSSGVTTIEHEGDNATYNITTNTYENSDNSTSAPSIYEGPSQGVSGKLPNITDTAAEENIPTIGDDPTADSLSPQSSPTIEPTPLPTKAPTLQPSKRKKDEPTQQPEENIVVDTAEEPAPDPTINVNAASFSQPLMLPDFPITFFEDSVRYEESVYLINPENVSEILHVDEKENKYITISTENPVVSICLSPSGHLFWIEQYIDMTEHKDYFVIMSVEHRAIVEIPADTISEINFFSDDIIMFVAYLEDESIVYSYDLAKDKAQTLIKGIADDVKKVCVYKDLLFYTQADALHYMSMNKSGNATKPIKILEFEGNEWAHRLSISDDMLSVEIETMTNSIITLHSFEL